MAVETEQERSRRRWWRTLFDGVADLYQASRLGYPSEIVEFVVDTAGVGAGSTVLEVGCGTGQLTGSLATFGFDLTAIDIGPSMVAGARRRVGDPAVSFHVTSFEDFAAADASFELIVSGTAFHWVDPEVKFSKSARLLRPGGWLALLATGERYDDPFGAALRDMFDARSEDRGAWRSRPSASPIEISADGLFEPSLHRADSRRTALPVDVVVGVENTRATSLSWPADVRRQFSEELRQHLQGQAEVNLSQETSVTMARVRQDLPASK